MNDELIYQQLEDIRKSIHNVENKIIIKMDNHEKRISRLEGYQKGILFALTISVSVITFILSSHILGL